MPLEEITDGDHNYRGNYLGENGVYMTVFNQNFQQQVVDKQIGYKHKKIAEQLYAAPDI